MAFTYCLALTGLITTATAAATDAITGVSWGAQRMDIFGADSKSDVFHKYYTAFGWGPDDAAHGNLELFTKATVKTSPSVASWGSNRLDFVFVDTNGDARHKYWDGTSWGPRGMDKFELLGKGVRGKLAINSWGPDRFDVVGLSADKTYVHKAWTGNAYYPEGERWESLGGAFSSPPATVSWGSGRLDIFGITDGGNVTHKFWDGYQWQPSGDHWENLGGHRFGGSLTASSMSANRFDIWAVSDKTGELWHLFWDGSTYRGWENLGGNFANAPQVVHWGPNRIDILGKEAGSEAGYKYKYWDGYQWNGWYDKGGPFASEPALVSVGDNDLNLFGVDRDGKLKLQVWDGSQWLPGSEGWYELGNTKVGGDDDDKNVVSGGAEKAVKADKMEVRVELKFRA